MRLAGDGPSGGGDDDLRFLLADDILRLRIH